MRLRTFCCWFTFCVLRLHVCVCYGLPFTHGWVGLRLTLLRYVVTFTVRCCYVTFTFTLLLLIYTAFTHRVPTFYRCSLLLFYTFTLLVTLTPLYVTHISPRSYALRYGSFTYTHTHTRCGWFVGWFTHVPTYTFTVLITGSLHGSRLVAFPGSHVVTHAFTVTRLRYVTTVLGYTTHAHARFTVARCGCSHAHGFLRTFFRLVVPGYVPATLHFPAGYIGYRLHLRCGWLHVYVAVGLHAHAHRGYTVGLVTTGYTVARLVTDVLFYGYRCRLPHVYTTHRLVGWFGWVTVRSVTHTVTVYAHTVRYYPFTHTTVTRFLRGWLHRGCSGYTRITGYVGCAHLRLPVTLPPPFAVYAHLYVCYVRLPFTVDTFTLRTAVAGYVTRLRLDFTGYLPHGYTRFLPTCGLRTFTHARLIWFTLPLPVPRYALHVVTFTLFPRLHGYRCSLRTRRYVWITGYRCSGYLWLLRILRLRCGYGLLRFTLG